MIKILIVDDNKNNRMILNLLLEDYLDEHEGFSFEIDEVENGKLAVEKAQETAYNIVFMDIMMPEMNGVDATRLIRQNDKNVMIIAVSAIDDSDYQRQILSNGAEDYISKPINADIFNSRIGNYLSLIESRHHKKFNSNAINIYTKEVFSRRLIFMITSEDTLSEFWEYYLLSEGDRCELLSDVVRAIYSLSDLLLKFDTHCEVIVEESESHRYFTLSNINMIDAKLVKLVMLKNPMVREYQIQNKLISFSLPIETVVLAPEEPIAPAVESVEIATPEAKPVETLKSLEHHIYSYMDVEDLEELEIYLGKLSSLFLMIGSSELEDEEIVQIYSYLAKIAKILTVYTESYPIGQALLELSDAISSEINTFRENSEALAPMTTAFSNDLTTWNRMIFHEGAPSVSFLDDTISANSKTIVSMLVPQNETEAVEDLDDIFDF